MTLPDQPFEDLDPAGIGAEAGLRDFMLRVYAKLGAGLVLSAAVAWAVAEVSPLRDLFFAWSPGVGYAFTWPGMALLFSPLLVLAVATFLIREPTSRGAATLYWSVMALMGGSLSLLLLSYTGASLTSTLLVTAGAFAALSLAGWLTRRNLSRLGGFMTMALSGLILAMLANLLLRSPTLYLVLNLAGVVIFAVLVAADTQRLRRVYAELDGTEGLGVASWYGALTLYLNLINLLELFLSLTGRRRR